MKISIIIPVYNAEKYLAVTVDSILNQDYKNFELILVNDGSTDSSLKICEHYAQNDNRVKVITQLNKGVSVARNTGIENASGEWITFIDSDDWIGPNYFLPVLNNANADVVLSSIQIIKDGVVIKYKNFENYLYDNESFLNKFSMHEHHYAEPFAKFFKRDIIIENNLRYIPNLSFSEDRIFNLAYILHCKTIVTSNESTYFYRKENESSLSSKVPGIETYQVLYRNAHKVLQSHQVGLNIYNRNIVYFLRIYFFKIIKSNLTVNAKLELIREIVSNNKTTLSIAIQGNSILGIPLMAFVNLQLSILIILYYKVRGLTIDNA